MHPLERVQRSDTEAARKRVVEKETQYGDTSRGIRNKDRAYQLLEAEQRGELVWNQPEKVVEVHYTEEEMDDLAEYYR